MTQLLLANIAAPIVLSLTGNFVIFLSIVPLEMGVLWWFCQRRLKLEVSLPRLFLISLLANTITSVIGITATASVARQGIAAIAAMFFPTVLIEWLIYIPSFAFSRYRIPKRQLLIAAILANLASYLLLLTFLLTQSYPSPFWQANPAFGNRSIGRIEIVSMIETQLKFQQNVYLQHARFTNEVDPTLQAKTGSNYFTSWISKLYQFQTVVDAAQATVTVTPKEPGFKSYAGSTFVVKKAAKPQFDTLLCQSEQPSTTAPILPTYRGEQVQCPSGSSELSSSWFLP